MQWQTIGKNLPILFSSPIFFGDLKLNWWLSWQRLPHIWNYVEQLLRGLVGNKLLEQEDELSRSRHLWLLVTMYGYAELWTQPNKLATARSNWRTTAISSKSSCAGLIRPKQTPQLLQCQSYPYCIRRFASQKWLVFHDFITA